MAAKYFNRGLTVLGVTNESDVSKIERFVESMGSDMDYTVAIDAGGAVSKGAARPGSSGI